MILLGYLAEIKFVDCSFLDSSNREILSEDQHIKSDTDNITSSDNNTNTLSGSLTGDSNISTIDLTSDNCTDMTAENETSDSDKSLTAKEQASNAEAIKR